MAVNVLILVPFRDRLLQRVFAENRQLRLMAKVAPDWGIPEKERELEASRLQATIMQQQRVIDHLETERYCVCASSYGGCGCCIVLLSHPSCPW